MRPISDWLALRPAFFSLNNDSKRQTKNRSNSQQIETRHTYSFSKKATFNTLKKPVMVSSLIIAGLSLQGFGEATQLDQVIESQKLRVVSVAGDTTFFSRDSFLHGFGYEMSREFARDLNVKFEFKQVATTAAALDLVKKGKADIALTTATTSQLQSKSLAAVDLTCGNTKVLTTQGLDPALNWAFRDGLDPLVGSSHGFVCEQRQVGSTKQLAAFYSRTMMNDQVERTAFAEALSTRLPLLKASFQMNAKQQKIDWQLLAAVSYQESHLVPTAISPTGVTGLMMLTQGTAMQMGVKNRRDPVESIKGGAQYLKLMQDQYTDIPNPDRVWFSLAAYNMGTGTLERVRTMLRKAGKNPNNWADVFQYLADNKAKNAQYGQCMHYVTRIRGYLEAIKQDRNLTKI